MTKSKLDADGFIDQDRPPRGSNLLDLSPGKHRANIQGRGSELHIQRAGRTHPCKLVSKILLLS